jgi:hypothetical protein
MHGAAPYIIDILIRLLVPLVILRSPWWGMLFALGVDGIDLEIIHLAGHLMHPGFAVDYTIYQAQDKLLDIYMFMFAVEAARRYWPERLAYWGAVGLFLYRLLGVVLFELTHWGWMLVIFPNPLELYYLFYTGMTRLWPSFRIQTGKRLAALIAVCTLLKLPQEYILHVMRASHWLYFKHHVLGWPD